MKATEILTFVVGDAVWPLTFLLCFLLVLRKAQEDIRPVFTVIVKGLADGAQRNATSWAIAMAFGLSASLAAFYDVFNVLGKTELAAMSWHQYAALWSKVLNPFIVAALAYITQSNIKTAGTNPPFSKT